MQTLSRRSLLMAGAAASIAPAFSRIALAQSAPEKHFAPKANDWRTFEVSTSVTVPDGQGRTRLWLPVPNIDNDYQRGADTHWTGNASKVTLVDDKSQGVRFVQAEFDADVAKPQLTVTSRVSARNRIIDWSKTGTPSEDPAVLKANLQPTRFQPIDGPVRDAALAATAGASSDVEKVRGIYKWIVSTCHREPSVRGCGTGDVVALLQNQGFGGKCADLSGLFVSMARSVGVPARDVYGLRVAPSAFGYKELGGVPDKLSGAQHCRAEAWLSQYGWVAMDPADVLKVMRQETAEWIKDVNDPLVAPVNDALFGNWEGNWIGWNSADDIVLPGSSAKVSLPFLMYPQGEGEKGRFDDLSPDAFRYAITSREISA